MEQKKMTKAEKLMVKAENKKNLQTVKTAIKADKKELKAAKNDIKIEKKAKRSNKLNKASVVGHSVGMAASAATGNGLGVVIHGTKAARGAVKAVAAKSIQKNAEKRIANREKAAKRDMKNMMNQFSEKSAKLNDSVQKNQPTRDKSVSL